MGRKMRVVEQQNGVRSQHGLGDVAIQLRSLRKVYENDVVAVDNLDLDIRRGELVCLVGPSGCGKTTTMKMINHLITPSSGSVEIDGLDVGGVNPVKLRRGIGYVIQQVGLFPHENIWENVTEVPRLLGWRRRERRERAAEMLRLVDLDPETYGDRFPAELSGGQQQRVGVARALAADPPVLLMDEPFSAIDPIARGSLQREFIRIQKELHKTIVMVTHDVEEAIFMADRIAVFGERGLLQQYDTPVNILARPANEFVSRFIGGDRGIRQLGVSPVSLAKLAMPLRIRQDAEVTGAAAAVGPDPSSWAVVVDASDKPCGWITSGDISGASRIEDGIRPVDELIVRAGDSLRRATARILENDTPWVLVVDDESGVLHGVLTLELIHAAVRSVVDEPAAAVDDSRSADPERVEVRAD